MAHMFARSARALALALALALAMSLVLGALPSAAAADVTLQAGASAATAPVLPLGAVAEARSLTGGLSFFRLQDVTEGQLTVHVVNQESYFPQLPRLQVFAQHGTGSLSTLSAHQQAASAASATLTVWPCDVDTGNWTLGVRMTVANMEVERVFTINAESKTAPCEFEWVNYAWMPLLAALVVVAAIILCIRNRREKQRTESGRDFADVRAMSGTSVRHLQTVRGGATTVAEGFEVELGPARSHRRLGGGTATAQAHAAQPPPATAATSGQALADKLAALAVAAQASRAPAPRASDEPTAASQPGGAHPPVGAGRGSGAANGPRLQYARGVGYSSRSNRHLKLGFARDA